MTHSAKTLPDGSLQVTSIYSKEDLENAKTEIAALEKKAPLGLDNVDDPAPQFLGISFERKTSYCVSCPNGFRYTIWAYGDIHAFINAIDKCGPAFSMSKGAC
jgi:hypothetical protein